MEQDQQQLSPEQMQQMQIKMKIMQLAQTLKANSERITNIQEVCMERCISGTARQTSNSEQKCLWRCAARYSDMETFMTNRLQSKALDAENEAPTFM